MGQDLNFCYFGKCILLELLNGGYGSVKCWQQKSSFWPFFTFLSFTISDASKSSCHFSCVGSQLENLDGRKFGVDSLAG